MHIVAYLLIHLVGEHFLLFLPDFLLQLLQPTLAMSISQAEAEPTVPPTLVESPSSISPNPGPGCGCGGELGPVVITAEPFEVSSRNTRASPRWARCIKLKCRHPPLLWRTAGEVRQVRDHHLQVRKLKGGVRGLGPQQTLPTVTLTGERWAGGTGGQSLPDPKRLRKPLPREITPQPLLKSALY